MSEGDETVEIRIPAKAEFVRIVRLAVTGVASRMAFSYDEIEDIKLAVSEACNNAIQHAQSTSGQPTEVLVQFVCSGFGLSVMVQDEGTGMPLDSAATSIEAPEPLDESGMGLFLMRALMDEVNCESSAEKGTIVRMVKRSPKGAG